MLLFSIIAFSWARISVVVEDPLPWVVSPCDLWSHLKDCKRQGCWIPANCHSVQYAHNVDVPMLHTMQSTTVNGVFITTLTHVAMIHPMWIITSLLVISTNAEWYIWSMFFYVYHGKTILRVRKRSPSKMVRHTFHWCLSIRDHEVRQNVGIPKRDCVLFSFFFHAKLITQFSQCTISTVVNFTVY